MSVHIADDVIRLEGACPVEEAETLLIALQQVPGRSVDISALASAHLAVIQVLFATRPNLVGSCANGFLETFVLPELRKGTG
ncbi:hypothetical protein SLG_13930 [Sphingobium sp. SYK-6]|uniref:hypothetical protein n=1 Tax=Sphingobium sp. (strain NBRC 103272 / SYK-6) TaxID=627192 RepID=UPI00022774CC|nr:hypothetical protein [Sphingobium sp. SYK-6]BAK66068.1 hypothetical protein SLG_13930 [Sphingobium sp. SYK-6]